MYFTEAKEASCILWSLVMHVAIHVHVSSRQTAGLESVSMAHLLSLGLFASPHVQPRDTMYGHVIVYTPSITGRYPRG